MNEQMFPALVFADSDNAGTNVRLLINIYGKMGTL